MNDKQAHSKLKKIQQEYNGYRNSRRERNERHQVLNDTIHELKALEVKVVKTTSKPTRPA